MNILFISEVIIYFNFPYSWFPPGVCWYTGVEIPSSFFFFEPLPVDIYSVSLGFSFHVYKTQQYWWCWDSISSFGLTQSTLFASSIFKLRSSMRWWMEIIFFLDESLVVKFWVQWGKWPLFFYPYWRSSDFLEIYVFLVW